MNDRQKQTVQQLIHWIKVLRGLEATVKSERKDGNDVYFQLDVPTPNPFPELLVSEQGTLNSDDRCIGGRVKCWPNVGRIPAYASLAYADECIAGKRSGSDLQWADVIEAFRSAK